MINSGTKSQYLSLLSSEEVAQKSGKESSAFQYNDSQGKIEALRQVLHNNRRQSTNFANLDRAINNVILSVEQIQKNNSFKENLARSLDAGLNKTSNTGFLRNKVIGEVFGLSIGKDKELEDENITTTGATGTTGTTGTTRATGTTGKGLISEELKSKATVGFINEFNKILVGANKKEIDEVNKYFDKMYNTLSSGSYDKLIEEVETYRNLYNSSEAKDKPQLKRMYSETMNAILKDKVRNSKEYLTAIEHLEYGLDNEKTYPLTPLENFYDYIVSQMSKDLFSINIMDKDRKITEKVRDFISFYGLPIKDNKIDFGRHYRLIQKIKEIENKTTTKTGKTGT